MVLTVPTSLVVGLNTYVKYAVANTEKPNVITGRKEEITKSINFYSLGNTPIKVSVLENYLEFYPLNNVAHEIISGFKYGFSLKYFGSREPRESSNLKSALQLPKIFKEKLMKEVKLGRIAGPFRYPPFPTLQVSPMGLVPKKDGDFRLIQHLSYPENNSINDFIDKDHCSVQYSSVDEAACLINRHKTFARLSQCDVKAAFRLLPIAPHDFDLLGIKFQGEYYLNKMLPMGASISCALWEKFAKALHWIIQLKSGNDDILHYLDDFLFVESSQTSKVGNTLKLFQEVCNKIGIPLASDKTTLPTTLLMFLGIEFDTQNLIMRLPNEKLVKLSQKIRDTLDSSKITLKDMQSLLGLLNFACKVVAPGRTFCRRLINSTIGVRKSYFKIRVNKQMKADLEVWLDFLKQYNGVTVITDNVWVSNEKLELFTDSAGGSKGGYGIYFAGQWAQGTWPKHWVETGITRDMTLLELFPVVAALMSWESYFVNKKVIFHVDNQAVVQIINMKTSKSSRVMTLVRQMVLMNLKNNTLVKAIYIPSKQNQIADCLSRSQWGKFRSLAPEADQWPTKIPTQIWNI